jgi:branched-chain amino acid transport system ATP-binding protein
LPWKHKPIGQEPTPMQNSAATNALLSVRNLDVRYDQVRALKGISFDVAAGETVVLLGPNGAGKSTVINTIMGLVKAYAGSITFVGKDITSVSPRAICTAGIGFCPEGRLVFGTLTVLENLLVGAYRRKEKAEINEDLDFVFETFPRLRERQSQWAGTLSGGEQQMVAIGRALMGRPTLLLMDEPSLGMAPVVIHEVIRIIRGLQKRGLSILLVEQNAGLALGLADRGYVISLGEIATSGTRSELRESGALPSVYLGVV